MTGLILLCTAAYFLGSIPFGLVVGRLVRGVDLRQVGSGNIGAANAFRTLGPRLGVLVLALDLLKGLLPVLAAGWLFAEAAVGEPVARVAVGLFAIVGHNCSVYLGFKGGKGIATTFGVVLGISFWVALVATSVWGLVIWRTRYASLASLCAALSVPLVFAWQGAPVPYVVLGLAAFAYAVARHRRNIRSLLDGTELRIDQRRKTEGRQSEG